MEEIEPILGLVTGMGEILWIPEVMGEPTESFICLSVLMSQSAELKFSKWRMAGDFRATPFGQLPLLEIDGQVYSQSNALSTYLANEFGYYGQTNLDRLRIDQVVYLITDFVQELYKFFFETEAVKKTELKKHFADVVCPKFLGFFEKLLEESGTGYFVGTSLTLADLVVHDFVSNIQQLDQDGSWAKFSRVKALLGLVESNDTIKAYIVNRKSTTF